MGWFGADLGGVLALRDVVFFGGSGGLAAVRFGSLAVDFWRFNVLVFRVSEVDLVFV